MAYVASGLGRLSGPSACLAGRGAAQEAFGKLLKPLAAYATQLQGWQQGQTFSSASEPLAAPPGGGGTSGSPGGSSSSAGGGYTAQPQHKAQQSTINQQEAEKFAALAGEWWDPAGPFAPLHAMNPVRCRFLRAALCGRFGRDAAQPRPLAGLRLLDVGCGGGLLSESLARMGAHVTGVDVNEAGIATAAAHAGRDPDLAGRLQYRTASVEQLVQQGEMYDAVIASEVIEHVASMPAFCTALAALTRPGGGVAISTLNRTPRSFALAIVAAEYVLRWVPRGTHDWDSFVTPEELVMQMEESTGCSGGGGSSSGGGGSSSGGDSLQLELLAGMEYNPLTRSWSLGRDTAVNYIAFFSKPAQHEQQQQQQQQQQEAPPAAAAAAGLTVLPGRAPLPAQ